MEAELYIQPATQVDPPGEKPKFFPLFYKKPLKTDETTASNTDEPLNETRPPMSVDDIDPVSSPPPGPPLTNKYPCEAI